MWDAVTVDHAIGLFRGILWLTGTTTGAYLCFSNDEQRPLLTFLGVVCVVGAFFNVFVVVAAVLMLMGVIVG